MKPRILVADDESLMRHSISEVLGTEYEVTCVATGREVYSLLTGCRELFDAALLDIRMPEWGGDEAWEMCHALGCEIPVAFMSGARLEAPKGKLLLIKPFRREELLDLVALLVKKGKEWRSDISQQ